MKNINFFAGLFLITTCSLQGLFAQDLEIDPVLAYKNDLIDNKGNERLFNEKMLNVLFSEKVGTAFGATSELSLQKYFASIDGKDNSLSIGINFDSRGEDRPLEKLDWVISASAKFTSKDKFATVSKNGEFLEDNIGLSFKFAWIGNGTINFNPIEKTRIANGREQTSIVLDRKKAIKLFRETNQQILSESTFSNKKESVFLYDKYCKKQEAFNKDSIDIIKAKIIREKSFNKETKVSLDKKLKKKSDELYEKMAKEEIKYINENKLYRFVRDYWVSGNIFVPLGNTNYQIAPDSISNFKPKNFYAFTAAVSLNGFVEYSQGVSLFGNVTFDIRNNNNIITEGVQTTSFQESVQSFDDTVIVDNNDIYITDYKQFITPRFKLEGAIFFNNLVGFSPAIEINLGEYDKRNWKFGVPFSFKDKEGKPKVNFELLWKEQRTLTSYNSFIGISTNFVFGKLIN